MMKLSKNMEKALKKCTYKWQSAYEMSVNINTLEALRKRGLIEVRYGPGSMAFPRTGIEWKLFELFDTTFGYYDKSGIWQGDGPSPNGKFYDKSKDTGWREGKLEDKSDTTTEDSEGI